MKKGRHEKIIEIIKDHDVETQEELAELLRQAGFLVTQATVSRDIRELNLSKVASHGGKSKYAIFEMEPTKLEDKYIRVLRDAYTSSDTAQNLLVIRTVSGMAMAVAAAVDALKFPHVVGCIAGDDTIMVATKSNDDAVGLKNALQELIK